MTKAKERKHLDLLYDIGELSVLVSDSEDVDSFLQQVVSRVATQLHADVGSIYLMDDAGGELVLRATQGLNPRSVGRIRMKLGEGLVGTTMERMEPLCDGSACDNPLFKYFEEADEAPYRSFLSVPIYRGIEKIGVLVVQHRQADFFNQADIMALRAIAAQLAGTVANAGAMIGIRRDQKAANGGEQPSELLHFIKGEATADGFALAPSTLLKPADPYLTKVPEDRFHDSANHYRNAVKDTIDQLKRLQLQLVERLPESASLIFEAHYMILKDPRFDQQVISIINQGQGAAEAVRTVARQFVALFDQSPSPYIKEKSQDIEDLARRILYNLRKDKPAGGSPMEGCVVIAPQLYPSDLLKLASETVAGIILVGGGATSHVAIVARSLKIPMIIVQEKALLGIPDGTPVLMDADVGNIYVNPTEQVRKQFEDRNQSRRTAEENAVSMQPVTFTADGIQVNLLANINLLSELTLAKALKAEGVGLYRSEFPFIVRSVFPSEEEQRLVYERLFEHMGGRAVFVRTLDVGGDKVLPYLNLPRESNPELGLRSIRFLLNHPEVFDQQIRAILRAGVKTDRLGIIFPMISSVDEFSAARKAVCTAMDRLKEDNLPHNDKPAIGAMIEMPSVLAVIDELSVLADFFSIGTNDFIQYMLAVDRTNENVARYYQPFHPAILRGLAHIVGRVNQYGKPISVCGEVAHDSTFIPFLLGIGVRRLSVDPQFLPMVQKTISGISIGKAKAYADALLQAATVKQVGVLRNQLAKDLI